MLEVDETTLKAVTSAIDEVLSLIEAKKDIRIVIAILPKVSNRIRAMAEIRETPDNRFASYIISHFLRDVQLRFVDQDEDWYQLNKEHVDQCLLHLKNLLNGLKTSFNSKSFEKAIDVIKMFFFAYWETTLAMTS